MACLATWSELLLPGISRAEERTVRSGGASSGNYTQSERRDEGNVNAQPRLGREEIETVLPLFLASAEARQLAAALEVRIRQGEQAAAKKLLENFIDASVFAALAADWLTDPLLLNTLHAQGIRGPDQLAHSDAAAGAEIAELKKALERERERSQALEREKAAVTEKLASVEAAQQRNAGAAEQAVAEINELRKAQATAAAEVNELKKTLERERDQEISSNVFVAGNPAAPEPGRDLQPKPVEGHPAQAVAHADADVPPVLSPEKPAEERAVTATPDVPPDTQDPVASAPASNFDPVPTGGINTGSVNADGRATPEEDSKEFAYGYLQSWSSGNERALADIREFFASQVNYLGRLVDRRGLYEAKRRFAEQWPIRHYRHKPESMTIRCELRKEQCLVESLVEWKAESAERNAVSRGVFRLELGLDVSGQKPVIKSENRHRIQRS